MNTGILLLQMGGPDSPEAIRPFLRNLFADREIIQLPGGALGQRLLGTLIVRLRLAGVRRNYRLIGGASPLRAITELQARRLQAELRRRGRECPVAVAMRYWHPTTGEGLAALEEQGVDRLIALSLYPQYSAATTGSSLRELASEQERRGWRSPTTTVDHWFDHPGYIQALANRLRTTVESLHPEARRECVIVWSAHGLPKRFVQRGDPYVAQIEATMTAVVEQVRDLDLPHRLGYQSRTGPLQWTGPGTEEVLAEEAKAGRRTAIFVPVSFVSDHIETLYELDILFTAEAGRLGFERVLRVPSFNDDEDLAQVLADLVEGALGAGRLEAQAGER